MNNSIIVATNNQNKVSEIKDILTEILPDITVSTLVEVGVVEDIEEYGTTFHQNALIKAEYIAKKFPRSIIIADDSGLEVTALKKAPGVYSKRYASETELYKTDVDGANNEKLLNELATKDDRSAVFKTVLSIIVPEMEPIFVSGAVEGTILSAKRGENGFGYDPIFTNDGFKSFAEISAEEKNNLSHRANALKKMAKLDVWSKL